MRSGWMTFTAAFALLLVPLASGAADADVQEQLRQMQERMLLLEDKLQNTSEQLEAATSEVKEQKQVMSNAGLQVDEHGASGIDSFLQSLEIGGWVNISYWHNFNDPDNGECGGLLGFANLSNSIDANTGNAATANGFTCSAFLPARGLFNPLNPDAQGFSFDQLWFELERPVSPEQRSGFRVDIATGKIASLLGAGAGRYLGPLSGESRSDSDIYIHQANIQYLWDAPYLGDTKLTLGKFSTLLGYEVAQAPYNYNISRSILWAAFQPVDHLGFLVSGDVDRRYHLLGVEGAIDWDFGVVHGFDTNDPDINHGKTFTGRVRMTGENWSIAVAGITGAEVSGSESDRLTVVDVIMTWDPFTDLNLWMNFDRAWANPDGADPDAWGISIGGHYTINDRMGFTLRADFAQVENPGNGNLGAGGVGPVLNTLDGGNLANPLIGFLGPFAPFTGGFDEEAFTITTTLHYRLSDRIHVRGELRYDNYERFCRRLTVPAAGLGPACSDSIFNEGSPSGAGNVQGGDSDQFVGGVDVIYEF